MTMITDPPRLLIVDDEPDIREFLSLALGASGYDVRVAEDGIRAGSLVRELMPLAVILDVMMPGIDGFSVLQGLRSDPATQELPVVMLTAKTSDADVWNGWESGASYYMTKPFDIGHLIDYLESITNPPAAEEGDAA